METLDGKQGTAKEILKLMEKRDKKSKNQNLILKKTFLKYTLIRLRQKISFIAFKSNQTILQLFLNAIIKSMHNFADMGIDRPSNE